MGVAWSYILVSLSTCHDSSGFLDFIYDIKTYMSFWMGNSSCGSRNAYFLFLLSGRLLRTICWQIMTYLQERCLGGSPSSVYVCHTHKTAALVIICLQIMAKTLYRKSGHYGIPSFFVKRLELPSEVS